MLERRDEHNRASAFHYPKRKEWKSNSSCVSQAACLCMYVQMRIHTWQALHISVVFVSRKAGKQTVVCLCRGACSVCALCIPASLLITALFFVFTQGRRAQHGGAMKAKFIHEEHNTHTVERRGGENYSCMVTGCCVSLLLSWLRGPDADECTQSEQCDWQLLPLRAFNLHAGQPDTDNFSDMAATLLTVERGEVLNWFIWWSLISTAALREQADWVLMMDHNESARTVCVIQVISPTSTSLEFANHLLLCWWRRKGSRRKTLLFNLWVSVLPMIHQLVKMSSWERSHNVRWSLGTQGWLIAVGASCLGMSVVTFHSLFCNMLYPNLKKKVGLLHFINPCSVHTLESDLLFTRTLMRRKRCVDGGRWGTMHDQSCRKHAKRESALPSITSAVSEQHT